MADATTLISYPGEAMRDFNARIAEACQTYVTDIELHVLDGQPAVTLLAEAVDAEQEDVDAGRAEKVGDALFDGPPLCAAVAVVRAASKKAAAKSESELDKLYNLAAGEIVSIDILSADSYEWIEQDDKGKDIPPLYAPTKAHIAIVVWEVAVDEDDGDSKAEAESESESQEEST